MMLPYYKKPNKKVRRSYYDKVYNMFKNGEITKEKYEELCRRHKMQLEKKRKYIEGDVIHTFEELLAQDLVWMFGRPMSQGFVVSQQFNTIILLLKSGKLKKCIKKDEGGKDGDGIS